MNLYSHLNNDDQDTHTIKYTREKSLPC